jgi:hypothetical protein
VGCIDSEKLLISSKRLRQFFVDKLQSLAHNIKRRERGGMIYQDRGAVSRAESVQHIFSDTSFECFINGKYGDLKVYLVESPACQGKAGNIILGQILSGHIFTVGFHNQIQVFPSFILFAGKMRSSEEDNPGSHIFIYSLGPVGDA